MTLFSVVSFFLSLCAFSQATYVGDDIRDVTRDDVTIYTPEWRSMFTEKQLMMQPPWVLANGQPFDGSFQVRHYLPHWKARSHIPCMEQDDSSSVNYMNLYFYYNKYNYQLSMYNLTYPILDEADLRDNAAKKVAPLVDEKEKVENCTERYSTIFYVPIPLERSPATPSTKQISLENAKRETYAVREYPDHRNFTLEYCNEQKDLLQKSLTKDGMDYAEDLWYCAAYEPGNKSGRKVPWREVWMKIKDPEEDKE